MVLWNSLTFNVVYCSIQLIFLSGRGVSLLSKNILAWNRRI